MAETSHPQNIVEQHRKALNDRKTLNIGQNNNNSIKSVQEQLKETENEIVNAINKVHEDDKVVNKTQKAKDLGIKKLVEEIPIVMSDGFLKVMDDFYANVVGDGFIKDLSFLKPSVDKFAKFYATAEQESQQKLSSLEISFNEAIKTASENQISLLRIQHQASIKQEKKRFDMQVKDMQQKQLELSVENAKGDVVRDLIVRYMPSVGVMVGMIDSMNQSAKVWNRFKDEGFWKQVGSYFAYNEKGIGGSLKDLAVNSLKSGILGLLGVAVIKPLTNILKGFRGFSLSGFNQNMKAGSKFAKVGGVLQAGLGLYNAYDIEQRVKSGEITRGQANREQSSNAGGTVGGIVGGVLGTFLGPIGTIVGSWLGDKLGTFIGGFLYDSWDSIVGFFKNSWSQVTSSVEYTGRTIKRTWNNITGGVSNFITDVGTFFSNMWGGIVSFISNTSSSIINTTKNTWSSIINFFTGMWDNITTGISNVWISITDFINDPLGSLGIDINVLGQTFDEITNGIKNWFSEKISWVTGAWSNIKSFLGIDSNNSNAEKVIAKMKDTGVYKIDGVDITKTNGKDITEKVREVKNNTPMIQYVQTNMSNNVNNNSSINKSTPLLSTSQPDPIMLQLGTGSLPF